MAAAAPAHAQGPDPARRRHSRARHPRVPRRARPHSGPRRPSVIIIRIAPGRGAGTVAQEQLAFRTAGRRAAIFRGKFWRLGLDVRTFWGILLGLRIRWLSHPRYLGLGALEEERCDSLPWRSALWFSDFWLGGRQPPARTTKRSSSRKSVRRGKLRPSPPCRDRL